VTASAVVVIHFTIAVRFLVLLAFIAEPMRCFTTEAVAAAGGCDRDNGISGTARRIEGTGENSANRTDRRVDGGASVV